jgi:hypothetical protein
MFILHLTSSPFGFSRPFKLLFRNTDSDLMANRADVEGGFWSRRLLCLLRVCVCAAKGGRIVCIGSGVISLLVITIRDALLLLHDFASASGERAI